MQAPEEQILALYRRWWVTTERRSPDTVDHCLASRTPFESQSSEAWDECPPD